MNILLIAFFGLLGIFSRYGLDQAIDNKDFPASTFLINILGCCLAGLICGLGEKQALTSELQSALLIGFCGGFTTFSAYAIYALNMLEKGRLIPALSFWLGSPILGLASAATTLFLTRKFLA